MALYDDYLTDLDASQYDYGNKSIIEGKLKLVLEEALAKKDPEMVAKIRLESEVLAFSKSIQRGISPLMSETGRDKDENEVEYCWPEIKSYDEIKWNAVENRFRTLNNLYCKYEYGMLLYLSGKKKDNDTVVELLKINTALSKVYESKAVKDDINKTHYTLYLVKLLRDGIELGSKRKKGNVEVKNLFDGLKQTLYSILLSWDISGKGSLRIMVDFTNVIVENFSDFTDLDLLVVLEKNWDAALKQKETYEHGAIGIAEIADKLAQKLKHDRIRWHRLIAECYEEMAIKRGGMIAPDFFVHAMRHYKIIGDTEKVRKLHIDLNTAKKNLNLSTLSYELPSEESKKTYSDLVKRIRVQSSEQIIDEIAHGKILPSFAEHKERQINNSDFTLSQIISTAIYDKHGNKNISLKPESSEEDSSFYSSYSLEFQIPSQKFLIYFNEAIRSGKIKPGDILNGLKNSWYGEEIIRTYNGGSMSVIIFELLEPGVREMLVEFKKYLRPKKSVLSCIKKMFGYHSTNTINSDFVCAIDSLAPKIEYVLRLLLEEKLGIPTSYIKEDGTWEEKTLTALLSSFKEYLLDQKAKGVVNQDLLIDDVHYFDFVMNHKAGLNLRNKVSHAHLDRKEYTPLKALLILSVYLRISTYTFTK